MSPLDRLLAEELPTGQVPDYPPARNPPARHRPWTPEEQAAHRDELLAALTGTTDHRTRRRHLRAVPPAA